MADHAAQPERTLEPAQWVERHGDALYRFALARLRLFAGLCRGTSQLRCALCLRSPDRRGAEPFVWPKRLPTRVRPICIRRPSSGIDPANLG